MIKITSVNVLYSNEAILEIDKVGVTLKSTNKKGVDAILNLTIREKSGQDLLTQDFELFIGENKTAEYIIPLDVPITGNFPCEFKVNVIVDGKIADESQWRDLIEAEEGAEGSTVVDGDNITEDTEVTVIQETDFKDDEEDTETEIIIEEIPEKPVEEKLETEKIIPSVSQQESWGILLEEGKDELYEEKIEGEIQPGSKSKKLKKNHPAPKKTKKNLIPESKEKEKFEEELIKKEQTPVQKTNEKGIIDNTKSEVTKKVVETKEKEVISKEIVENEKKPVMNKKKSAPIEDSKQSSKKNSIPDNKDAIVPPKEETTTEINIIEANEEEITPTLTDVESESAIKFTGGVSNDEKKEKIKTPEKKEKRSEKKKKKSPMVFIIIMILIIGLGSGYVFRDKLLKIIKKDKKEQNDESMESLLTTEKDTTVENILNSAEKKKYKIETLKISEEQLNSLVDVYETYKGELIEKENGYIVIFEPKDKKTFDEIKSKLKSLQIKIK